MNILIDIGHPAHVHYYRNLESELSKRGHRIFWTVKDLPVARRLLDAYGFQYKVLPKKRDALLGKIFNQIVYDAILYRFSRLNKIDIGIGTSVSIAHVSRMSSVRSVVFDDDDDEVQPLVTRYVQPFADVLLSPDALKGRRRRRDTLYYPGYHELAYLHPNRFTPDPGVLAEAGIGIHERFFVMRFNAFKAHHDGGVIGLSIEQKRKLVDSLRPMGRICITSEREIEPEFKGYALRIEPERMHSLLSYATLLLGDSQTMSSEAAVLGVPALRYNSLAGRISYLEEQENRYGLTFGFKPGRFDDFVGTARRLAEQKDLKREWGERRRKMLAEKIDVTAFWAWFIDSYPQSVDTLKRHPHYPLRFR